MFDDYDTTNSFIKYNKIFDIKMIDDIEKTCQNITNEICSKNTINRTDIANKEIYNIVRNGVYGLNILDSRHVASICLRYCHYYDVEKTPHWYLFRLWRR
jgi:hypothetical protein